MISSQPSVEKRDYKYYNNDNKKNAKLIFKVRDLHQTLHSPPTTGSLRPLCKHLVRFRGIKMNRKEASNNYITFFIECPRDGSGLQSTEQSHRVYPDQPSHER